MRTFRRAASLLLLLPVAVLAACEQAENRSYQASEVSRTDSSGPALTRVGVAPKNTDELVAAVEAGEWGEFWNELAWDVSDNFDGEVAIWGVLVVDGEREKSFLTEVRPLDGEGPADVFDLPASLYPEPDNWTPRDEFIPLNPDPYAGSRVADFFQSDAWRPGGALFEGQGISFQADENWVVTGIVDGILDEPEAAVVRERVTTKMLIMPLVAERQSGQQGTRRRPAEGLGTLLVGYEEAP